MLLYWDTVGTIIPAEFMQRSEELGEHTRSLLEAQLLTAVIPGMHLYKVRQVGEQTVAVGMPVAQHPRTDPHERHYRMRLLSWMNGVKANCPAHTRQPLGHANPALCRVRAELMSVVGIELRRACCRWRVTSLALSIARWDLISTMATFPEAPL